MIDLDLLEREMTNRANAASSGETHVTLWRELTQRQTHFFAAAEQVSLCGMLALRDDLIDPRARCEPEIVYCRACWRRFCAPDRG